MKHHQTPPPKKPDYKIAKSIKRIFDQLEFNMATNEVSDGGTRNKEDLERKERLMQITEQEKKRFQPKWNGVTFHQ